MSRGGARPGAGRPKGQGKYKEPTKPVRVPESLVDTVMRLVEREGILCLPKFSEGENSQGEATKTDIMTIDEVASYLKLKLKTAYHLAAKGDIPGFKVGGAWRFRRSEIEKWIAKQERDSKKA